MNTFKIISSRDKVIYTSQCRWILRNNCWNKKIQSLSVITKIYDNYSALVVFGFFVKIVVNF